MARRGGFLNLMVKMAREAERAERRNQRELQQQLRDIEREEKAEEKRDKLEAARLEFARYENHLAVLGSIHKDCGPLWDWQDLSSDQSRLAPKPSDEHVELARSALENYSPGFFDRLFGSDKTKRSKLEIELAAAEQAQQENIAEWERLRDLAKRIIARNPSAYIEALKHINPFDEVGELGAQIELSSENGGTIEANVFVHGDKVIPKQKVTLLKSGKSSRKDMPKTQFNLLYQDYVCGCALRVGREMFAILPNDTVWVHVATDMLDKTDGHLKKQTILSIMMPRETLGRLNFRGIDCSDSMENFVHNMKFKNTAGFSSVEKLCPQNG